MATLSTNVMEFLRAEARVHVFRGRDELQLRCPGWYRKIDCDILDIQDGRKCICGQLDRYDDTSLYRDGVVPKYGLMGQLAPLSHYGFFASCLAVSACCGKFPHVNYRDGIDAYNELLIEVWKEEITKLLEEDKP